MMVSIIQSGPQSVPYVTREGFKNKPADEAFALSPSPQPKKKLGFQPFGADGFTVSDAIDIINPLQHLPIIGPLYREFTSDSLDPFSRIAGNTLFFGPFGAAFSSINVAIEEITGKDVGSNVIAMLKDENTDTTEPQTAHTSPVNQPTPASDKINITDPVLAWATAEIVHRNSEALKQGINLPTHSYSTLVVRPTPTSVHKTQANIASTHLQSNKLSPEHTEQALSLAQKFNAPAPHGLLATNAYFSQNSIEQPALSKPLKASYPKTNPPQILGSIPTNGGGFLSSMNYALSKYHQAQNSGVLREKSNIPLTSTLH